MKAANVNDIQRRTAYNITAVVCKLLGDVTVDELKTNSRHSRVTTARHIIGWVLYRVCRYSTTEIGTLTGRDHTTILHSVMKVDGWLDMPKYYKREVDIVRHFTKKNDETQKN